MTRTMVVAGICMLVAVAGADAAVLCQKKSGTLTVHADACKKKETLVDPVTLGLVGPPGTPGAPGTSGAPGTRAWAHVNNGSTDLVAASGIASATHPSTGLYCLTPNAGIDPDSGVTGVTVEYYHSSGSENYAQVVLPRIDCPTGTFEVRTFGAGGSDSDSVGFVFVAY